MLEEVAVGFFSASLLVVLLNLPPIHPPTLKGVASPLSKALSHPFLLSLYLKLICHRLPSPVLTRGASPDYYLLDKVRPGTIDPYHLRDTAYGRILEVA